MLKKKLLMSNLCIIKYQVTIWKFIVDNINFKILVPSIAAGAIIGKGGEAIGQIQRETQARIKLSKADDFYPGTTERVCLIQGTLEGVTRMHNYIMERILDRPEHSGSALSYGGQTHMTSGINFQGNEKLLDVKSCSTAINTGNMNQAQLILPWERHKQKFSLGLAIGYYDEADVRPVMNKLEQRTEGLLKEK